MNRTGLSLHLGIYRPVLSDKFMLDIFDLLDYIGMTKIGVLFSSNFSYFLTEQKRISA